jgi:hypothetical protein
MHEILENKLVDNAREVGTYMHERLHELKEQHSVIGDIRGRGLLAGVEFVQSRERREPFPANWFVALEATELARKHGLLVYPRRSIYGLRGDHVLIAPPLIIDRAGVDELIERFDRALCDLQQLLVKHIHDISEKFEDLTVRRFEQSDTVPGYARGDIDSVAPIADANVTAAMETGHFNPRDFEPRADDGKDEGN